MGRGCCYPSVCQSTPEDSRFRFPDSERALTPSPSRIDLANASPSQRMLRVGLVVFGFTFLVSTVGYVVAGWSWADAAYMVVLTVFGVGYGEVRPIDTPTLKLFTTGVIFAGCSSLIYVIGGVVQFITEGEVRRVMGIHKTSREISKLHDHTIICGYGRVGRILAAEMIEREEAVVILDSNPDRVSLAEQDGFLAVLGDATTDETLHEVGLHQARTLATVLPNDAANVFITLSARDLSDTIRIISRAECVSTERKLLRGGADHVVLPAAIGAVRIAELASCDKDTETRCLPEDRFRVLHHRARSVTEAVETADEVAVAASALVEAMRD